MCKIRGLFVCLLGLVLELYIVAIYIYNNNIKYKSSKKARTQSYAFVGGFVGVGSSNLRGKNGIGVAWIITPGGVVLQWVSVGKLPRSTFLKQKGSLEGGGAASQVVVPTILISQKPVPAL
jgi:hypothetical protein